MKKLVLLNVLLFVLMLINAQDIYVSPVGSNSNTGTINKPIASIQTAVDKIKPGGTIYLREGLYNEVIFLKQLKATKEKPITIKAYNNETVIIDGTVDLNQLKVKGKSWQLATDAFPETKTIYKLQLQTHIWQLFVNQPNLINRKNAVGGDLANYRMQVIARWPNTIDNPTDNLKRVDDGYEVQDSTWWSFSTTWAAADGFNTNHYKTTSNEKLHNLAALNKSFEGGTAILSAIPQGPANLVVNITKHVAGTSVIEHSGITEKYELYNPKRKHTQHFFVQHLNALDRAGEWYYDHHTKTIYFWAEGDINPNELEIRGKAQTYAFILNDCEHIIFDGIGLFASTLKLNGNNITFKNGAISYPDMPQTLLGKYENVIEPPAIYARECHNFTFYNNMLEYSQSYACEAGHGAHFENNYMHHLGMVGTGETGCFKSMNTFIYNTLDVIGHRAAVKTNSKPIERRNQSWNLLTSWGYLYVNDGVGFQSSQSGSVKSIRSYNWFIRTNKSGHRYDGPSEGQGFATLGLSHHLVGYKAHSVSTAIKGDSNQLYNYLGVESTGPKGDIAVRFNTETGEGNANTIMRNCAVTAINPVKWVPLSCIESNNWATSTKGGDMKEFIPKAHLYDFRPAKSSPFIDAGYVVEGITDGYLGDAPDIGAYEWGDDTYWIPGYKSSEASFHIPQNNSANIPVNMHLIFRYGLNCSQANVYFGTNEEKVIEATIESAKKAGNADFNSGEVVMVHLNKNRNIVTPTMLKGNPNNYNPEPYKLINDPNHTLSPNTTYYWRVDVINMDGHTFRGETIKFTTANQLY